MNKQSGTDLTIIGIGSSAGGLEAIRELVGTLPANLPVSYVVVQHMSPHHKSLMTELVARQTSLRVEDVQDGIKPEPNVIYITPPKTDVVLSEGRLQLVDPSPEIATPKPSVDRFLLSLAEAFGERSMAVILSGTGSDGAYGVQAIREAGGITIAQDNESAKYDGMPRAAVQTGCVDLVLRPLDIGTHLQKILTSPRDFDAFRRTEMAETPISDLLQVLLARTRVDFREYKQTTIGRRIERRMMALGIDSQEEYTKFCRNNPHAVDALFKDLLISVTRFFRDKEEFEQIKSLLPQLLEAKAGRPLRVWIAGCATGEEAYSIAMLISEALGGPSVSLKSHAQIFATDIDADALQVARRGIYGAGALNDIPPELGEKYLIRQNDGVRVIDNLRNAILFSDHNVCQDPPFQKVDLLCCRNLLIYFGNALQQKVMSRFHYSMTQDSLLFLGTAESIAGSDELFIQDRKATHIFRKRALHGPKQISYSRPRAVSSDQAPSSSDRTDRGYSTDRQLFEALAQSLGKNSVLVTEDYSIARVYGDISAYIQMDEKSSLKMHLDLLRSPFREEARSLITISLKSGSHRSGVRHLLAETDEEEVRLDVYPIVAADISERAALVVFSLVKVDRSRQVALKGATAGDNKFVSERIRELESEIASTREALQQTIEELETSNEELQSLNEELQSTNEELQATNEELETSNEELQSTNEELITVNEELQVTASELSGRTGELTSVLESTPLAIIVLDSALQLSQATRSAAELFQISRPQSNPHVSQCALPEGYPALAPICSEALRLGQMTTHEFTSQGTRVMLSCSPYFDVHGKILGVTIVVAEFPGLAREMEFLLDKAQLFAMHRTKEGKILRISARSAEALDLSRQEAMSKNYYDLVDGELAEMSRQDDQELLKDGGSYHTRTIQRSMPDGRKFWLKSEGFKYQSSDSSDPTLYYVSTDVTEDMNAHAKAQMIMTQMARLSDRLGIGYWTRDLINGKVHWSKPIYDMLGVARADYSPQTNDAMDWIHPDDREDVTRRVAHAMENGGDYEFKARVNRGDGKEIHVHNQCVAVKDDSGNPVILIGVARQV